MRVCQFRHFGTLLRDNPEGARFALAGHLYSTEQAGTVKSAQLRTGPTLTTARMQAFVSIMITEA